MNRSDSKKIALQQALNIKESLRFDNAPQAYSDSLETVVQFALRRLNVTKKLSAPSKESSNTIIKELKRNEFTQVMGEPTHMQGGIIDHLYIRQPEAYKDVEITYNLFAVLYSKVYNCNIPFCMVE